MNLRIISKPHAYLRSTMKTSVKFQKNLNKTVRGIPHTRYPITRYPMSIHFVKIPEKRLSSNCEKRVKINLWIISQLHAHLQSMVKTPVQFRNKTVGEVAHTKYPLSIHFHYQNARKMTKFKLLNKVSKLILGLYQNHMHIFKASVKFQKNRIKTVGGVAHTRYIPL